jgi:hypothetical protein
MLTVYWLGKLPRSIVQDGSETLAGSLCPSTLFDYAYRHNVDFLEVSNIFAYFRCLLTCRRQGPFFIFHLRVWHFLPILLSPSFPVCLYYQNSWPIKMHLLKRSIYTLILRLITSLAVQDALCFSYFSRLFPRKLVFVLPWFVDGSFFVPSNASYLPSERLRHLVGKNFIFVPGDRARNDALLKELSIRHPACYVRVSRSFSQGELNIFSSCEGVQCHSFVEYSDLLWLYHHCSMVLNLVDDRQNSAGMTVLFEALACNVPVVTPCGHSSSGFIKKENSNYIRLVTDCTSVSNWVEEVNNILSLPVYSSIDSMEIRRVFTDCLGEYQIFQAWKNLSRIEL